MKCMALLLGYVLCTKTMNNVYVNMDLWMLNFLAMVHKFTRLKPAGFLFMGPSQSIVYATAVHDVAEPQQRTEDRCN
jgi:hypothetical protein